MIVHLLWHVRVTARDEDDVKLLGVYSSAEEAQSASQRAKHLPGFCEVREGFEILAYEVDKDHWTEGFVSAD